jgi:hypothetical protein
MCVQADEVIGHCSRIGKGRAQQRLLSLSIWGSEARASTILANGAAHDSKGGAARPCTLHGCG